MKSIKLSLVAALLATTAVVSNVSASEVEVSANMALTSNYVWRGMTQSSNSPAVQGGVDLAYNGFYAGVWGSNVNFSSDVSMEADFYAGYAGEISGLSYDLGMIQYAYPTDTTASNFAEAYVSLGYDFKVASVSAMYYSGIKTDTINPENGYELGLSIPLPSDITLDATYGDYTNTGNYYSAGLTKTFGKFDVSIAYAAMDYDTAGTKTEDNIIATIGTSF
ncbi:hypothetical protein JHD48_04495 [Sulfurimonas sp. SAG-AH-194-I05]|nr:TorF family putative porin [Sulfurimonas sp. SAG-AH-194-I05]MDF1874989.1 hypothetical protein [Sulfurimonas sp. SAG-AH-194-I05]